MLLIVTFIVRFVYIINFSKHLCSYRALLLNDLYTPIVARRHLSCSGCDTPYIIKHLCLNYPTERIVLTTLVNALDF